MGILVDVSDPKWNTLSGKWESEGGSRARFLLQVVNELINSTLPFSKDTFVLAFGRHFDPEVFNLCSSLDEANNEQSFIENVNSTKKEEIINEVLDFLERNGAGRVRNWVQNTESVTEVLDTTSAAAILYYLKRRADFAKSFVHECLPSEAGSWYKSKLWLLVLVLFVASAVAAVTAVAAVPAVAGAVGAAVAAGAAFASAKNIHHKNSVREAMNKGKLLLSETRTQRMPVSRAAIISVKSASEVLHASINSQVTVEHVGDLLKTIEPYVYRPTPLIQAMCHSWDIFSDPRFEWHERVLFVLSDSQRADGSYPHQKLIDLGVTIINCFVTDQWLPDSHRLSGIAHQRWDPSKFTFRVSSITSTPKISRTLLQSRRWDMANANIKMWNFHVGMFIRILAEWYISFGRSEVLLISRARFDLTAGSSRPCFSTLIAIIKLTEMW